MTQRTEHTHVLFVEDDDVIREATQLALERDGYVVTAMPDGLSGLEAFRAHRPDIALLDVMVPGLDGVSLCRRIRDESTVPVIMLSARADSIDVVLGLEAGADDYVTKPFDGAVLVARIRAVLRRFGHASGQLSGAGQGAGGGFGAGFGGGPAASAAPHAQGAQAGPSGHDERGGADGMERVTATSAGHRGVLRFGDLWVDTEGMEVRRAGQQVALTPTEMRLLLEFSAAPGTVFSRDKLLQRVWDYGWGGDTRVVDVHVQRLRAKIGQDRIETVRGFGYKLKA
jgi:DNA-binding response OmpR family regulator